MDNIINSTVHFGLARAVKASLSQQARYEMIANNLANVETPGFKADRFSFSETLNEVVTTDLSQGQTRHTGNKLDMAIDGVNFFTVETPQGTRYTRNGTFTLNNENVLVTKNGDPVLGKNGPITIEGNDLVIDEDGNVWVDGANVDTLKIAQFGGDNPDSEWIFGAEGATSEKLKKSGNSYFKYDGDENEVKEAEKFKVSQGYIEQSNVLVMSEMVRLIETQRNFESFNKILQTFVETDTKATNEVGKLV